MAIVDVCYVCGKSHLKSVEPGDKMSDTYCLPCYYAKFVVDKFVDPTKFSDVVSLKETAEKNLKKYEGKWIPGARKDKRAEAGITDDLIKEAKRFVELVREGKLNPEEYAAEMKLKREGHEGGFKRK